jgi:hypothetical protein
VVINTTKTNTTITGNKKEVNVTGILVGILVPLLIIALGALGVWVYLRKKKLREE